MENIIWSKYPQKSKDWSMKQIYEHFSDYLLLFAIEKENEKKKEKDAEISERLAKQFVEGE